MNSRAGGWPFADSCKTGERGMWDEWTWFCSAQCWNEAHELAVSRREVAELANRTPVEANIPNRNQEG